MLNSYEKLPNGVIHQNKIFTQIQSYTPEYVETRYNTYGEKGLQMAFLRLGYLIGNINSTPKSILDIGYGNGDFLKVCTSYITDCYGNDVSNYPLPENVEFISDIKARHFDVICFFDVLEHFEEIDFIKDLQCNYIYISLPWCHYISDDWFQNWKHRRPDEHLWHFDDKSLVKFFEENGYENISLSNIEDSIRKPNDFLPNILTGVFRKK